MFTFNENKCLCMLWSTHSIFEFAGYNSSQKNWRQLLFEFTNVCYSYLFVSSIYSLFSSNLLFVSTTDIMDFDKSLLVEKLLDSNVAIKLGHLFPSKEDLDDWVNVHVINFL